MDYHYSFKYKGTSNLDKNLIIVSFSPDNGEVDTYLTMQSITGERYDGSSKFDYGAKYTTVSNIKITMIKPDGTDFTVSEFRDVAKWLTGTQLSSWLDLYEYESEEISYSFLCKCIDLKQYKMDSRTIGVTAIFESVSPWAYSPMQTVTQVIDGATSLVIENLTDQFYSYLYPTVVYTNSTGNALSIYNATTDETTEITNLVINEQITMNSSQVIYSDKTTRIFGDDFNFVWLKLAPGSNVLTITGNGKITITYRYPIKIGDCAIDIE